MRKSKGLMGLAFLLVLLGLGCLFLAYREQEPFQAIKVKGEALQKLVVQETGSQEADPMERTIDFAALQRINPEIVGWLYVPQIGVDSPILTGQTDTEYLTKDFEGAYSAGEYFYICRSQAFGQSGVSVCPQHGFRTDVRDLKQFTNDAFLAANPQAICIHRSVSGNCRWKTGRICRRMIPAFPVGRARNHPPG